MFEKIIWSAILVSSGLGLVVYTERVKSFTGSFDFAEKWFGSGGTYNFFKFLGVVIIIGSFLWLTGTLNRIMPDLITSSGISTR